MRHREATDTSAEGASAPSAGRQQKGFDWWAAPDRPGPAGHAGLPADAGVEAVGAAVTAPAAEPDPPQTLDPHPKAQPEPEWEPEPERGRELEPESEPDVARTPGFAAQAGGGRVATAEPELTSAEVYRQVQAGEEFQEIRREYRRFVFPACVAFLAWYLLYIVAAVTLPDLMGSQVVGPLNVAWLLGLLQFASTFLITWLYARHARDRRDRAALGLRWETQDRLR